MGDEIFRQMQARKAQWMREREIEKQREGMALPQQVTPGDLVNLLTEKLTSKMPVNQQKIERGMADEMETNTCSICYELMLPKEHSPMLLFPCGHTFCRKCLDDNAKKNGKKKCMWCRAHIQSAAINLSLQNLIVAYAKQRNIVVVEEPAPTSGKENYRVQLENYDLRCRLLEEEKTGLCSQMHQLQSTIEQHEGVLKTLKDEETGALRRLKAAEEELDLVRSHIAKTNNKIEELYRDVDEKTSTIQLIDETIKPLEREKSKLLTLLDVIE